MSLSHLQIIAIAILFLVVIIPSINAQNASEKGFTYKITPQEQLELSREKSCCPTDYLKSQNENYLNIAIFWLGVSLAIVGGASGFFIFRSGRLVKK